MKDIKITDLDYRQILIQSYKEFLLTEEELIVLLLIESLNKEKPSLITGEQLSLKMTYTGAHIDEIIISLMDKAFLSYEQVGGVLLTSCKGLYDKILSYVSKKMVSSIETEKEIVFEDNLRSTLQTLENEMKRALTPLEIEQVTRWYQDEIDERVITNAINECIMQKGKVSIKQVDRLIIKNLTHKDRVEEGFTTIDEKSKRDIKKAMDIASYDWVNNDDN